jgi:hypothetical protein
LILADLLTLKMEKAKEDPNKESQLEDRQNIGGQS